VRGLSPQPAGEPDAPWAAKILGEYALLAPPWQKLSVFKLSDGRRVAPSESLSLVRGWIALNSNVYLNGKPVGLGYPGPDITYIWSANVLASYTGTEAEVAAAGFADVFGAALFPLGPDGQVGPDAWKGKLVSEDSHFSDQPGIHAILAETVDHRLLALCHIGDPLFGEPGHQGYGGPYFKIETVGADGSVRVLPIALEEADVEALEPTLTSLGVVFAKGQRVFAYRNGKTRSLGVRFANGDRLWVLPSGILISGRRLRFLGPQRFAPGR